MALPSWLEAVRYHAITAFLFTKSDFKTTLIPSTVFSLVAAPVHSFSRLPHILFWVWLHLLQFNLSNQTVRPEEDVHNKPDRPLPSGRVTLRQAVILRWLVIPLCLLLSSFYSQELVYVSALLISLTIIYNELGTAAHWFTRNVVNGLGLGTFELGATLIAGADRSHIDTVALLCVAISAAVFTTTVHAQDFKDVDGDRLVGRVTLPMVFPRLSRNTMIVGMLAWSLALANVWELDVLTASVFLALGATVGIRFLLFESVPEDQTSYLLYNLWVSCVHALPGYWRFKAMAF